MKRRDGFASGIFQGWIFVSTGKSSQAAVPSSATISSSGAGRQQVKVQTASFQHLLITITLIAAAIGVRRATNKIRNMRKMAFPSGGTATSDQEFWLRVKFILTPWGSTSEDKSSHGWQSGPGSSPTVQGPANRNLRCRNTETRSHMGKICRSTRGLRKKKKIVQVISIYFT